MPRRGGLRRAACAALAALLALLPALGCARSPVELLDDESSFVDFSVKEETVYIDCWVTIVNRRPEAVTVELTASMPEDAEIGLLREPVLQGIDPSTGADSFVIRGESQASFEVRFVGEFAGTERKTNRLLPDVTVHVVN